MSSRIILSIIIIAGIFTYFFVIRPQQAYYYAHNVKINGVYLLKPAQLSDFELIDHHGNKFNKSNLDNHWTLLFFGFSRCNLICPTTLTVLSDTYLTLKKSLPDNKLPQVIFVSVDPEQDTIARLKQYMTAYNPRFIAAVTTKEQTIKLENAFHVTSEKIPLKNTNQYSINHSTDIILINPHAEIQAYFSYPQHPEKLAKDYYSIINKMNDSFYDNTRN